MSEKSIKLIPGVSVLDTSGVGREYKKQDDSLELTLSQEDYKPFFKKAVASLKEPVFFFIETPEGDSDEMNTYYLDNCTVPVAQAILKRYSGILYSDGIIRFGFGSHTDDDEIFMQEFQLLSIYSKQIGKYEQILKELNYKENSKAKSIWDILSDENVGARESVECDDECFEDIIANLSELGLYKQE